LYIEKLLKELIQEVKADEKSAGWKEAALAWKYISEITIQDSLEKIFESWSQFDFVYIIQDRSTQSGETKIMCIVDKKEGGKRIIGRGSDLIAAIKDAGKQNNP